MKAHGVIRRVDSLGRIVIPSEVRNLFGIVGADKGEGTALEIFVEDDYIMLKKYEPFCFICGNSKEIQIIDNKKICMDCVKKISHHLTDQSKGDD